MDSHIHLADFAPESDVSAFAAEARNLGVTHFVCNSTSENDWLRVLDCREVIKGLLPCVGLHPWFVNERSEHWLATLENLIIHNECGVGEIGLDRLTKPLNEPQQETAFRSQLRLAAKHKRFASIHCVRAWGWLIDVLQSEDTLPEKMLIHSYGGSADMVRPLADFGCYFSFSGKVLEENYLRARKALQSVPVDRLLIETDAPAMLPPEANRAKVVVGINGEELNHPANLPGILVGIAGLLGESPDTLQEILWRNATECFGSFFTK